MKLWHRLDCIYADGRLGQTEKHMAAYLAFRVKEDTMTCRLGAGTIARDTGFTRRNAQLIVNRLEKIGLVAVRRSGRYQGRNAANLYTLHLVPRKPEIASPQRYSVNGNSVAGDIEIASQQHRNSVATTHKPFLTVNNRGADRAAAPNGAARLAPEEGSQAKQRRQLMDLAPILGISRDSHESEASYLKRLHAANEKRLRRLDG